MDTMFLGVNGITIDQGYTVPTLREADMARRVVTMANEVIIVADYSKFNKVSHAKIADFEDADKVISDSRLDDYYEEAFSDMGVELLRA